MIGRALTHYKVVAELGAGGMGVVYKALDLRLDRYVALKVLPADKADNHERRSRFLHEARAASALNDPHIITIFDIFTDDGTDVLVMEFVQGRTLRDLLNEGPLEVSKAIEIALQVAEGVGTAHAAGIVHRDLKPGNVMVTDRGRVKVLDFGLAKLVGGAIAEQPTMLGPTTLPGMLLGTVDYMSPEQAKGDPIDARSDVFSLGAMLYEMVTGARPFVAGHTLGVLHEILYGTIVPPRTKRPEITVALESAVLRALERDLARRCPSMEAFAADLRRAQQPSEAGPPAAPVPAAAFLPPPLPPPAPPQAPPPQVSPPFATGASSPPPASSAPPLGPFGAAGAGMSRRERRRQRAGRGRRSPWRTLFIVLAIVITVTWSRSCFNAVRGSVTRAETAAGKHLTTGDRFGTAVEDAVASMLDSVGSGSADIQVARGNIYWKRAQKNHDPDLMKKAEDAFNEALRLEPDPEHEAEARETLRQIAAAKAATTGP